MILIAEDNVTRKKNHHKKDKLPEVNKKGATPLNIFVCNIRMVYAGRNESGAVFLFTSVKCFMNE